MTKCEWANSCSVGSRYQSYCECGAKSSHIWYGNTANGDLYCDGCSKQISGVQCQRYLLKSKYQTKDKK